MFRYFTARLEILTLKLGEWGATSVVLLVTQLKFQITRSMRVEFVTGCCYFLHHKNPPSGARVEPATLDTEGQRQTNRTTHPAIIELLVRVRLVNWKF
ncbi:hypothetical protein TNCV_1044491 [Trichonephila clavipes]|nr:hypothetical protein TNCV_1044491 [Trichonephila clavipes]